MAADAPGPIVEINFLSDGERGFGTVAVEPGVGSNVIELDAPLRRLAPLDRAPAPSRRRINPYAVELAVRLSDAFVLAASGAAAYWLQPLAQRPHPAT